MSHLQLEKIIFSLRNETWNGTGVFEKNESYFIREMNETLVMKGKNVLKLEQ